MTTYKFVQYISWYYVGMGLIYTGEFRKEIKKWKNNSEQILVRCSIDEFEKLMPILCQEFEISIEYLLSDEWPVCIDFDNKVAFTVEHASLLAACVQCGYKIMNYQECLDYLNKKRGK